MILLERNLSTGLPNMVIPLSLESIPVMLESGGRQKRSSRRSVLLPPNTPACFPSFHNLLSKWLVNKTTESQIQLWQLHCRMCCDYLALYRQIWLEAGLAALALPWLFSLPHLQLPRGAVLLPWLFAGDQIEHRERIRLQAHLQAGWVLPPIPPTSAGKELSLQLPTQSCTSSTRPLTGIDLNQTLPPRPAFISLIRSC